MTESEYLHRTAAELADQAKRAERWGTKAALYEAAMKLETEAWAMDGDEADGTLSGLWYKAGIEARVAQDRQRRGLTPEEITRNLRNI